MKRQWQAQQISRWSQQSLGHHQGSPSQQSPGSGDLPTPSTNIGPGTVPSITQPFGYAALPNVRSPLDTLTYPNQLPLNYSQLQYQQQLAMMMRAGLMQNASQASKAPARPTQFRPSSVGPQAATNASKISNVSYVLSTVPSFRPDMDEASFLDSLSRFLSCLNLPLKRAPVINNRPLNLLRLFKIVNAYGGFRQVCESRRWGTVVVNVGVPPPLNAEIITSVYSTYHTLLHPYEQYMLRKIPIEAIEWPADAQRAVPSHIMATSATPPPPVQTKPVPLVEKNIRVKTLPSPTELNPAEGRKKRVVSVTDLDLKEIKAFRFKNDFRIKVDEMGPTSYLGLGKCLKSPSLTLVIYGINCLRKISCMNFEPLPTGLEIKEISDGLIGVFKKYEARVTRKPAWALLQTELMDVFDLKLRSKKERLCEEVLKAICVIYRNLSSNANISTKLAQDAAFNEWLISNLFDSKQVGLFDVAKDFLVILDNVAAFIKHEKLYENSLKMLCEELDHDLAIMETSPLLSILQVVTETGDPEILKKKVLSLLQWSSNFCKLIPQRCNVVLSICLKLSLTTEESPVVVEKASDLVFELIAVVFPPIVGLCQMLIQLLSFPSFVSSPDYSRWLGLILHNPSFGFSDNGYFELCLHLVQVFCSRLDDKQLERVIGKRLSMMERLFHLLVLMRELWLHPSPSPPPSRDSKQVKEVSPLLKTHINSVNSHPYLVFRRLLTFLQAMTLRMPDLMVPMLVRIQGPETITEWTCCLRKDSTSGGIGKELVQGPDLIQTYEIWMHVIMEYMIYL